MRFPAWTILLVALSITAGAAPAAAQLEAEWSACTAPDVDQRITSCTTLIQSDRETTQNRAIAYNNRGVAYDAKRDYDRAIADFSEAIRLDPKDPYAYHNRGAAYAAKKDHERAIADYSEAIQLDPRYINAYFNRGLMYLDKGDRNRAIADFKRAVALGDQGAREELRKLGVEPDEG